MRAIGPCIALVAACGSGSGLGFDAPSRGDGPVVDALAGDGSPPRPDAYVRIDAVLADAIGLDGGLDASADAPIGTSVDARAVVVDSSLDATVDAVPDARPDAPSLDAGSLYNVAFVTSTRYDGQLGGLAGADAKCMERAAAAGFGG